MADEQVAIKIEDKVDAGISTKIRSIESSARSAHGAITKLNGALAGIRSSALAALGQAGTTATTQLNNASIASQRLATAVARTQQVQSQAATAAQRLATAQQQTATAASNSAAAQSRAAVAALRLQNAQNAAAAAATRLSGGLASVVRQGLLLAGAGFGSAAILSAADSYTVLQNKLQNVSESMAANNRLTAEVFALANKTRTPVMELAAAFSRFDAALQLSGASQKESLRITETVTKALKVGGATAGETGSALLQLSQAFNKGKLNGDEFRSLMENMPVFVKKAIAEAAKVPISGIFDAAASGKLTIDTLREAFGKLGDVVDQKFGKTMPTLNEQWTVFKNKLTETIGEINKSLGVTQFLGKALAAIGNNLPALGVALTAITGLLLLAFGPTLVTMFAAATTALKAFTLAIASNPIGLIAVAISTAIAYLVLFRNEIQIGIYKTTSLGDLIKATWNAVTDVISNVTGFIASFFDKADAASTNFHSNAGKHGRAAAIEQTSAYGTFFADTGTGFAGLLRKAAKIFDGIAAVLAGTALFGAKVFLEMVDYIVNQLKRAANAAGEFGATLSNKIIDGLNLLNKATGQGLLDHVQFEKFATKGAEEFKNTGQLWAESMDSAFNATSQFGAGVLVDGILKDAQKIGAARNAVQGGNLRGEGVDTTGGGTGNGKAAEKRAAALAKINTQLDMELNRLFMLKPEREIQEQFDKIELDLMQKKIKLTNSEAESIKGKLRALQDAKIVQQQFDRIYEESVGPQRDYNASITAANKLLEMGAISRQDYNREIVKSTDALKEATDPFYRYNLEMKQEADILKTLPQFREAEQRVQQLSNDLRAKGTEITDTVLKQLREEQNLRTQLNAIAAEENRLYAESNAAKALAAQTTATATSNLLNNPASGYTAGDAAQAVIDSNPQLDFSNTQTAIDAHVNQFANMYAQLKTLLDAHLITEQTAAAVRTRIWVEQQQQSLNNASNFFGNLAQLQKSSNSKIAAIGKAAAIAQAMINTYQAATAAYAAMASIPVYGPALGAAAAAAAIVAGIANVAQIRAQSTGFRKGGYTGDIARDAVAGPVHGQEFVMDAGTTARIGRGDLEALRSGAARVQRHSGGGNGGDGSTGATGGSSGGSGGQPAANNVRVMVIQDPSLVGQYMNTPEGETDLTTVMVRAGFVRG